MSTEQTPEEDSEPERTPDADAQEGPGSLDGVEISMESQREDTTVDSDSRVLLRHQTQLIRRQVLSETLNVGLKAVGGVVGLLTAALIVSMVWNAARSNAVVVQALNTPPALADKGLSGIVVAGRLQDGLTLIQTKTRGSGKRRDIGNAWADAIAVEVPQTGISISELDRLLRQKLGHNTYVSGDLIQTADGNLALTVRGGGILAKTFTGPEATLDALSTQAAEYIFGQAEPTLYVSYLNQLGRWQEVVDFVGGISPNTTTAVRSKLIGATATAYAGLGDMAQAVNQNRLSIRLDPTNWPAWGNMVGSLYEPGTEEQALRAGLAMRAADAVSRTTHPRPTDYANVYLLEQNWPAYLAAIRSDSANGGVQSNITASVSLAEAEGRLHDWEAARSDLAQADPTDGLLVPTRGIIEGYRLQDAGDYRGMIAALELFDAQWLKDPNVAFTYPDNPCWLAYAYGVTGQTAKARAIFDRIGAYAACYAFEADVVEATGNRPAADAAYLRAINLAPSMPFAYHRRALALMKRGQPALAAMRFRDANARGGGWADPLKGWGDALAAQGQWQAAADKYEQAVQRAPGWHELRLAYATALERIGKRGEARKQREAVEA